MTEKEIASLTGFNWDKGNHEKNWTKHKVTRSEIEEVFFNKPVLILDDDKHSKTEHRWKLLGKTIQQRFLLIIFTVRNNQIRPISARPMSRRERQFYEETA